MERKMFFRRFAVALFVCFAVFFTTCKASDYISDKAQLKQVKFVQNIVMRKDLLPHYVLTDKNFHTLSEKYISSVLDSVFSFEILPTQELDTFIHIFINLNSGIQVLNFDFDGHNIIITLLANEEESFQTFCSDISSDEYFQSISVFYDEENESEYKIYCETKPKTPKVNITDILKNIL